MAQREALWHVVSTVTASCEPCLEFGTKRRAAQRQNESGTIPARSLEVKASCHISCHISWSIGVSDGQSRAIRPPS